MKAKDLAAILLRHPEAEVWYEDGNFGGPKDQFDDLDISMEGGKFLINSPYWQDCNS